MKLSRSKLTETLRRLADGKTAYQARKVAKISVRRVYQVKEAFDKTGEIPDIGKYNGRPRKPFEEWEIILVKKAFEKYRVSADTLERCIDRDCKKHIGHNRIHQILVYLGYAKKKDKRDIRKRNWKFYERRHSLTAVHIDWHYFKGNWVFGVEDDASRKLLALIEDEKESLNNSIKGMEEALKHGPIKQCISDHGSTFTTNFIDAESRFRDYLKSKGVKQILCKVRHPQSNGKMEKWFDCYDRNREAFKRKEEFMNWYNDVKPHRSLNFDELETPSQAFIRKMRK
ncbi:transposase [Candidatus Woesearchaeota archaeon]|nr:transposase [Candidatus Woesearchaeota archaeon]